VAIHQLSDCMLNTCISCCSSLQSSLEWYRTVDLINYTGSHHRLHRMVKMFSAVYFSQQHSKHF